jgi:hypothetical protein
MPIMGIEHLRQPMRAIGVRVRGSGQTSRDFDAQPYFGLSVGCVAVHALGGA